MYVCCVCHFEVTLDDLIAPPRNGRGVCLRCYVHEVDPDWQMPLWFRRELERTLAAIEVTR